MESLGGKLKSAREEKGLTLDQASRETNISLRYIEALENENFSDFPGETYITGFLRNYGAYLDLDVQKVLSLYRALRIQEQPVPVEQLLKPAKRFNPMILIVFALVIIALGICGGGAYLLYMHKTKKPAVVENPVRSPSEFVMDSSSLERRLYKNDSILVPVESNMYKLEVINLGEAVTISTPGGSVILDLSQEANLDLSNNGIPDLRIMVVDFAKNKADMGVLLHFSLTDPMTASGSETDSGQSSAAAPSAAVVTGTQIIPPTPSPYPFTLQSNFQGYCMFRWEILNERDRRGRNERYFQRADELNIQAQNGVRLWASNAQAAKFLVIGGGRSFPLEIGTAGEVVVADIRWVRGDDNQFRLILVRLET